LGILVTGSAWSLSSSSSPAASVGSAGSRSRTPPQKGPARRRTLVARAEGGRRRSQRGPRAGAHGGDSAAAVRHLQTSIAVALGALAHGLVRPPLTPPDRPRYALPMTARQQWSHGIQWGGLAWLGYVSFRAAIDAYHRPLGDSLRALPASWFCAASWPLAAAWLSALVLIVRGSPWSRVVMGGAILAQILVGAAEAASYGGAPNPTSFTLRFFLPMCLPLLPLVVLRVGRPRVVIALAALGRWREAWARFGGLGPLAVAVALVSVNRGAGDLLLRAYHGATTQALLTGLATGAWARGATTVLLFGLAALIVARGARQAARAT